MGQRANLPVQCTVRLLELEAQRRKVSRLGAKFGRLCRGDSSLSLENETLFGQGHGGEGKLKSARLPRHDYIRRVVPGREVRMRVRDTYDSGC